MDPPCPDQTLRIQTSQKFIYITSDHTKQQNNQVQPSLNKPNYFLTNRKPTGLTTEPNGLEHACFNLSRDSTALFAP